MNLQTLLAYADVGWHIFPIRVGAKDPPLVRWRTEATSDPVLLADWFHRWPSCNWGVSCGPSGLIVVDLDRHHPEANGIEAWAKLVEGREVPQTYAVSTPSGGRHLYFRGVGKNTASKLAPGIDTRGDGGYVVMAGSALEYVVGERIRPDYVIDQRCAVAPAPDWLVSLLAVAEPLPELGLDPVIELDQPRHIAKAVRYLAERAEPAVEGAAGDACTLHVAMACKDLGLTADTTFDLMAEHYNYRCSPPWTYEELRRKVDNAYRYGRQAPGAGTPEAAFSAIPLGGDPFPVIEDEPAPTTVPSIAMRAADIKAGEIPRRRWLLGHSLLRNFVRVLVAPGGTGKSIYAIQEAISVATGVRLTGEEVVEQGAVWIYNTEDPLDEIQRRIVGIAQHFELPIRRLDDVHVTSGRDRPLILVEDRGGLTIVNKDAINAMIQYIHDNNIKLLVVDPLVKAHRVDENNNGHMDLVIQAFGQIIAHTGCAVSLVHHTRKAASGAGAGEKDASRGASAVTDAARVAHTLSTMSPKTAEGYGLTADEARWYVRLDDAKANLAPPQERTRWFRKTSVTIPNGESVGVLELANLEPVGGASEQDSVNNKRLQEIIGMFADDLKAPGGVTRQRMAAVVQQDPEAACILESTKPRGRTNKLACLLPVALPDGRVIAEREVEVDGKTAVRIFVEEA